MADLKYTVDVDTAGGVKSLNNLQNQVKNTQDTFTKFQNVIGGIAIGGFIANAFKMADAISDTAKAAGVSTQALLGFANAVERNGGSFDGAQQGVLKFNQSIAEAADGSRKTQEAFAKVGVSLNDIATLSEEDLLRKTVDGLANVKDNSQRAALGMDLFGKAAKGTDFAGVASDIDSITKAQKDNASAIENAAKVNDSLTSSYRDLQTRLLNALEPLAKVAELILAQKGAIDVLLTTLISVGSAYLIFSKVIPAMNSLQGSLAAASIQGYTLKQALSGIAGVAAGPLAGIGAQFGNLKDALVGGASAGLAGATALERLGLAVASVIGIFARFLGVIAILWAVYDVINAIGKATGLFNLGEALDKATQSAANFLGISYKTTAEKEKEAKLAQDLVDKGKKRREVEDAIGTAYKALVADLQKGVDAYMRGNDEVLKRLKLDGELIGLTEQQKAVRQALFDVESKNSAELTRLQELYNEKSKSGKKEDQQLLGDIQIAMEKVKGSLEGQKKAVEDLVVANAARVEQENQLKALADYTTSTQISNAKALRDIQHEMATSTMSAIEKKYADIARAADESARAEIDKENSRRRQLGLVAMTADEEAKYYAASKRGLSEIQAATKQHYEQSRTWSSGWTKAWRDYADDATNAAKSAENIFKKTTQGIEDAIVNAAKTGKWEFKDMLNSIGEEILRSGIRKGITGLFEGLSGGEGFLGSIGKMFGMQGMFGGSGGGAGQGGSANNPIYVYDIAGGGGANRGGGGGMGGGNQQSSGGGWWDTITEGVSGVWDSVTSGLGNVWDTVTSGIGDIFGGGGGGGGDWLSGITDLFGGFFANGGTLGAGKFGIAGENGPELISGPATITPMGGSTSVTYNINAVDAQSFKAMIAADPGFIHAVAQQGSKSMPRRY